MARGGKQGKFLVAVAIGVAVVLLAIVVVFFATSYEREDASAVEHDMELEMGMSGRAGTPASQLVPEAPGGREPTRDAEALLG